LIDFVVSGGIELRAINPVKPIFRAIYRSAKWEHASRRHVEHSEKPERLS
jgi:hypothetical protein